jgi:phosphate transport system permease protein
MTDQPLPATFNPAPLGIGSLTRRSRAGISGDKLLALLCRLSAVLVLVMLAALVWVLVRASLPAIGLFGASFLYNTEWRANELQVPRLDAAGKIQFDADDEMIVDIKPPTFGAATVIWGTAVSSAIALMLAIPLSLGAALFLVRIAPNWLRPMASFLIEFLAAIPSIAYGIWGLFVLAPFLQGGTTLPGWLAWINGVPGLRWLTYEGPNYATPDAADTTVFFRGLEPILYNAFGNWPVLKGMFYQGEHTVALTGRDMLCGGLILGIMVLPIITAISRDVLSAVPRAQIEGTLALGATWWQSARQMLAYSRAGLFGAVMLGLARAAGETMAVTMVIGNVNQIAYSPFAPAQTMASLLANQFNEASDIQRSSLTYVALILLIMSLLFNVVARYLVVGKNARSAAAH